MRQALLAVSFGTSVEEARALDLAGVERALRRAAPELPFDRAYTSPTVRRILARRGERVPGLEEALESQAAAGTEELYVVPTHVLPGAEYDRVAETAARFRPRFSALHLGRPLLWDTAGGRARAQVLDSLWPAVPGTAAVLVGHGSGHPGSMAYPALQGVLELMGRSDLVVGTVEGRPDQAAVLKRLEALEVERVILLPLLLAAGVHAREDIAGPQPDSWISTLKAAGFQTWARLEGMGRLPQIQALYQAGLERLREGAADRAL